MSSLTHSEKMHFQHIDLLRIFATMSVMVIHIDPMGSDCSSRIIPSAEWLFAMLFDGLSRWAVPIFFMISGALFLDKRISITRLYRHNISHIAIAFLFWSFTYAVIREMVYGYGIKNTILETLYGHYHMWFLFSILCLYIAVPFLQRIVEHKHLEEYLLVVCFVFSLLLPQLVECTELFSPNIAGIGKTILSKFDICFVSTATFYFVLGHYLHHIELSSFYRRMLYVLGFIGAILTVSLTCIVSIWKGVETETFFSPSDINISLFSIAIFVFAKYNLSKPTKHPTLSFLSKHIPPICFGAYLIHPMVIELLYLIFGANTFNFGPFLTVPITFLFVCPLSFLCSWVIKNIPIIGKHLI